MGASVTARLNSRKYRGLVKDSVAVLWPTHDHIYGDWRQRLVATLVARMAETLSYSVGHEFGSQVVVLFLWPLLSSCKVNKKLVQVTPAFITLTLSIMEAQNVTSDPASTMEWLCHFTTIQVHSLIHRLTWYSLTFSYHS